MIGLANLRTLLAVADTGGVRSAALRLGRTPSAVSMALKQLEASIGVPLFEGERKARPTPVCLQIIERSRELLDYYDGTCSAIQALARNEMNRCSVASITSFAAAILPLAVQRLHGAMANLEVRIREVNVAGILELVADGKVDVGFVTRAAAHREDLSATTLLMDDYAVVCRSDDPLVAHPDPIPWSLLDDREVITTDSLSDIQSPEAVRALSELPFLVRSRFHSSSPASTFALVRNRVGIALLPCLCQSEGPPDIRFLPLADPRFSRTVSMITKKGRRLPFAGQELVKHVRSVVREYAGNLHYHLNNTVEPVD